MEILRLRGCQARRCDASNDVNKGPFTFVISLRALCRTALVRKSLQSFSIHSAMRRDLRSLARDRSRRIFLMSSVRPETPRSRPRWRHTNPEKNRTERCSFEDAFVLLGLEARAVGLLRDAQKHTACDQQPGAKEKFVSVLGSNVL
jgi:hypothetical protein